MSDDTLNPNFEWKKKSFGKKERLSRRIDARQATLSEKKQKNNFSSAVSLKESSDVVFQSHLKRMRKTIKQALDDDEEDEEDFYIEKESLLHLDNQLSDATLFKSLNEQEKRVLLQKQTHQDIQMQQNASKISALAHLNSLAKKAGLPKLSAHDVAQNMQNNGWGRSTLKMAVEHHISPDLKTGRQNLSPEKITKLMKGLKRLQKIGGISAVRGMKINDVIHLTDTRFDDKKVARLLLKKTGRKPNVRQDQKLIKDSHTPSKISFRKLIKQKRENSLMKV